jgi:uncharacterized protein (DUF1697 family)
MKYVALLRGVNVGGRIIKKDDIKTIFEKIGFKDVKTLLQSGNVIFSTKTSDSTALKQEIEEALTKTFVYQAKVWVIPLDKLRQIVNDNPFTGAPTDYHQYVIFFENGLEEEFAKEPGALKGEMVKVGQGVAYWKVQKGQTLKNHQGKLLAKAKYRDYNTNRNINTLKKLVE